MLIIAYIAVKPTAKWMDMLVPIAGKFKVNPNMQKLEYNENSNCSI